MEEEFEPKKLEPKKEEVKEEVVEKNEEVEEELVEEPKEVNEVSNEGNNKKEGRAIRIISRIVWTLILLIVIAEVVLGLINTQKINNDEKPLWCIQYNTETKDNKKVTTCNLGLYVIVKTKSGNKTETSLKPFFLQ